MHIEPTNTTLGAVVTGIDLRAEISEADADQLRAALDDRGALVFPGQHLDDQDQVRVGLVWGTAYPHPVTELFGGTAVVGAISNDADHPMAKVGELGFHTDNTFNPDIPDVALVRSVTAPPEGGNTVWSDARAAARALDPSLRKRLATMTAHHDVGEGMMREMKLLHGPDRAAKIDERFGEGQRHPVLTAHPRTQDETLFVNWGFTRYLVDVPDDDPLLDELFALFGDSAIQFEYAWSEGDLVVWDEHRTVHRGPDDIGPHRREIRRCTVGRHVPTAATPS